MGILLPALPATSRPERPLAGFAVAAAAHVLVLALLATVVPAERLQDAIRPMTVRLVEALPDLPRPRPPEPPGAAKAPPPLPLLASNAVDNTTPAFVVPPQPPAAAKAPPIEAPPAPVPAPPAITAARFDADYLHNPKPAYPHASRRLGEQGKVLLRVFVSAAGLAEKVEVRTSSGFARLDQAAAEAVGRWNFVPARRGDEAVAAWVQVPITFQLES